ncbi:hypothetical protein Metho_1153 [Methanomethylovorans hollandica DSM 15978]|uniref:Uncharacterized protein n=1 Tax=Methanomethylovorans hollandica (strain DSM 15978 / NBRC 107637 / DMS1) TaxID=867904 RepID=L0KVD1_METHD|nr:hypothetical protein [Methanomethylovorans hollandica]AGB49387.1 hypothetical protein Metho_1153 [Methanomethylovorans hollandica DSM 15978]
MDDELTTNQIRLLYLIHKSNTNTIIQGITVFRNAVYILSKKHIYSYTDFKPINHGGIGSSSIELNSDLNLLIGSNLIEKKLEPGPYTRMCSLIITDKGKDLIKNLIFDSIDSFLNDLNADVMKSESQCKPGSLEYYTKISVKLRSEVSVYFDMQVQGAANVSWEEAFFKYSNEAQIHLFFVTWIPIGPLHFERLYQDIKRGSPCTIEQKISENNAEKCDSKEIKQNEIWCSKIIQFNEFSNSDFILEKDLHIEYVIGSPFGNLGVELHRDGVIIVGISTNEFDENILDIIKKISINHLFSIMSDIQLDMFVFSKSNGIDKRIDIPGNFFAICNNHFYNKLENEEYKTKNKLNSNNKNLISYISISHSNDVIKQLIYTNIIKTIDDLIMELFLLLWAIWNRDLQSLNSELMENIDAKRLKSIKDRTNKIRKDLIDINLISEYLHEVISHKRSEIYKMPDFKKEKIDLLQWKLNDLNRLVKSSIDYHDKTNELISAHYEDINSEYDQKRNLSMNFLNSIVSATVVSSILLEFMPNFRAVLILLPALSILGYIAYKIIMYFHSNM